MNLNDNYVIVNSGMKTEAFLRSLSKFLGDCHPLAIRHQSMGCSGITYQYVGFGGEVWRGHVYYDERDIARAVKLIYNGSSMTQTDLALATCGLALLSFNRYATVEDFFAKACGPAAKLAQEMLD